MEERYAYRFPPCPAYDVEGLESWLESMAQKGLFLDKDPFFAGFATFRKGAPKPVRYRLQPSTKKRGWLEDGGPDTAAVELAEEYGWTYLGDHWEFSIYTAEDPNARELDTDPQIQALALQNLFKRRRREFIVVVCEILLLTGLVFWLGPITFLLSQNSWFLPLTVGIFTLYLILFAKEFRHFKGLLKRLALGESLSRAKDWRSKRWLHWISAILSVLATAAFLIGSFSNRIYDWEDRRWQLREETLPFATLETFGPFTPDQKSFVEEYDHTAQRTTLLAASQITVSQDGTIQLPGGTVDAHLHGEYYDLRTPWLAERFYDELLSQARREKYYHEPGTPDLPTDRALLYYNVGTHLLLLEGSQVLHIRLIQYTDEASLPPTQWAQVFAESILSNNQQQG